MLRSCRVVITVAKNSAQNLFPVKEMKFWLSVAATIPAQHAPRKAPSNAPGPDVLQLHPLEALDQVEKDGGNCLPLRALGQYVLFDKKV